MKWKFFCVLSIVSVAIGCTKSQIRDSLKANSRANQYTTVTIFPIDPTDKKFVGCLQDRLNQKLPNLKFISADKFREALFPWFEPETARQSLENLSAILTKPLVKKRIESLRVEFLICLRGITIDDSSADSAPPLAVVGYGNRETHIWTTVWDLKEIVRAGDTDISFKGKVVGGFGLIPPFINIWPAFTDTRACLETAKRISNCLTGKIPSTKK